MEPPGAPARPGGKPLGTAPSPSDVKEVVIGEGTYGYVYRKEKTGDRKRDPKVPGQYYAVKKFKARSAAGVQQNAIREVMLLKELSHDNVLGLESVKADQAMHTTPKLSWKGGLGTAEKVHVPAGISLMFEYCPYDLELILDVHQKYPAVHGKTIHPQMVKAILWQLLNGLKYLHANWIMHRDLKPSNILVNSSGVVKIADFGLARVYQNAHSDSLMKNGVVCTLWYRAVELLLGSEKYTRAVDIWSVGCIFAELLRGRPLFRSKEHRDQTGKCATLQNEQLFEIWRVLGLPDEELQSLPHWKAHMDAYKQSKQCYNSGSKSHLAQEVDLSSKSPELDLLKQMLELNPAKRITAANALQHKYFSVDRPSPRTSIFSRRPAQVNGMATEAYPERKPITTKDQAAGKACPAPARVDKKRKAPLPSEAPRPEKAAANPSARVFATPTCTGSAAQAPMSTPRGIPRHPLATPRATGPADPFVPPSSGAFTPRFPPEAFKTPSTVGKPFVKDNRGLTPSSSDYELPLAMGQYR